MMRLRRLDLTRFGRFTDFSLDFGPRAADTNENPDLHIIFGPNEAGKSTCFEAWLDLLYGIPTRSPYNFLHDYDSMEIGGVLEIDGAETALRRIKKQKNNLLDTAGQPLNPALLQAPLAGISREQYKAMFSLDDETIEDGGEDILQSGGDLGQMLFSAAAGLSDLGHDLSALREDCDAFRKARKQKTRLALAKRALTDLKDEIKQTDLTARNFVKLREALAAAETEETTARTAYDTLTRDAAYLRAKVEALPLLARLRAVQSDLAPLGDLPELSDLEAEAARALRDEALSLDSAQAEALAMLQRMQDDLAKVARDPAACALAEQITTLLGTPKERAGTAAVDLPKRQREHRDLSDRMRAARLSLGLTDAPAPDLPLLSRAEQSARALLDARANAQRAQMDQAEAAAELEALEDTTQNAPAPLDDLNRLFDELDPRTFLHSLTTAETHCEEAQARFEACLPGLLPWRPASAAPSAALPEVRHAPEHIARALEDWQTARSQGEAIAARVLEAERESAGAKARAESLKQDGALISDAEAQTARDTRDKAWASHLAALSHDSAMTFATQMTAHDALQDKRFAQAAALATLREAQAAADASAAHETALKREHALLRDAETQAKTGLAEIAAQYELEDGFDLRGFADWFNRLLTAQEAARALAQAQSALDQLQQQGATIKDRLAQVLEEDDADLAVLVKRAEASRLNMADAAARHEERATRRKDAARKLKRLRDTQATTQAAQENAQADWHTIAEPLPKSLQDPQSLLDALTPLRELITDESEQRKLTHRIAAMAEDAEVFARGAETLAAELGITAGQTPQETATELAQRLRAAEAAEALYSERKTRIAAQSEAVQSAARQRDSHAHKVQAMAERFGAATMDAKALWDAVEQSQKAAALRREQKELCARITTLLAVAQFDEAEATLEGETLPEVQALLSQTEAAETAARARLDESIGARSLARKALDDVGGDDSVARLEERKASLLASLGEEAREHLRLKLGLAAAELALTQYRETHRSDMLTATAEAFARLTDGHYHDLQTRPDGQRETLLALRASDGRSVAAQEMSKGTRFQLYLALRLAGYRNYAARGIALPFIADDIMETFDNTRTTAALGLLREMGKHGQALYFTHHEHVVELARETCGAGLKVHEIRRHA